MNSEKTEQELFNELSYYTLSHADPGFIHQYIVDAFTAQVADENTKPIAISFALIGLYLHLEKNYSGKEVQKMHMLLAKHRKKWPTFILPIDRGEIRVDAVIKIPPGQALDNTIREWCASVWKAYSESHREVAHLVQTETGR